MRFFPRRIEPVVRKAAAEFPAVVLTGPRQAGKTTLLRREFGEYNYLLLDLPDVRAMAFEDPRGLLDAHPPPLILDEVQQAPQLLPYLKARIDERRDRAGQYILTGSQNLLLLEKVKETLAGRVAVLRLLPASRREARGEMDAPFPWEAEGPQLPPGDAVPPGELWTDLLRGGYPELVADPERDARLWHAGYVQTYLERDVRTLRQVGNLSQFQSFLRALAARSGQLLNMSDLARDLGVAVNTVRAWVSVLEATFQIVVLRPYFANVGKRLVKTPKIYFTDTGTLCYLTGLTDPEHARLGPLGGAILETAVVSEVTRRLSHRGLDRQLYFWRTATGTEVDLLVEHGGKLVPLEVKLSATPRTAMADGIRSFRQLLGDLTRPGWVVHPGTVRMPLGPDASALPFSEL